MREKGSQKKIWSKPLTNLLTCNFLKTYVYLPLSLPFFVTFFLFKQRFLSLIMEGILSKRLRKRTVIFLKTHLRTGNAVA